MDRSSIAGIAEYVGHSDKATTLTSYTQVVPDELDAISLRAS